MGGGPARHKTNLAANVRSEREEQPEGDGVMRQGVWNSIGMVRNASSQDPAPDLLNQKPCSSKPPDPSDEADVHEPLE